MSRQSRHFSFADNMIKVLCPICTLDWRVNNYVYPYGEGIYKTNKVLLLSKQFVAFGTVLFFLKMLIVCFDCTFSLKIREDISLCY